MGRCTGFCKARGRSVWSKPFGPRSLRAVGGLLHHSVDLRTPLRRVNDDRFAPRTPCVELLAIAVIPPPCPEVGEAAIPPLGIDDAGAARVEDSLALGVSQDAASPRTGRLCRANVRSDRGRVALRMTQVSVVLRGQRAPHVFIVRDPIPSALDIFQRRMRAEQCRLQLRVAHAIRQPIGQSEPSECRLQLLSQILDCSRRFASTVFG